MSVTASLLVLAAAVAHATWNFYVKRAGGGGPTFIGLYAAASTLLYLPLAVLVPVVTGTRPQASWLVASGVSSVLHMAYYLLLSRGYAVGDLSVVYPLARGTGPLLSVTAAVLLLGERPGTTALVGAAVVIGGVFTIATPSRFGIRGFSASPDVLFGVATGAVIAGYTLWDAHAVTSLGVPPLVLSWATSAGQVLLLGPHLLTDRPRAARLWRDSREAVIAVAVLSPLAYVLVLVALQLAPVSVVAPARELSIVIGSFMAWRLLHEPQPRRRMSGAAIVLAGVVLLAVH